MVAAIVSCLERKITGEPMLPKEQNFLIFTNTLYICINNKQIHIMAELKNQIKEAERYLANARQILSEKAGKDGDYYTDKKYVRMAGDTAWKGVLVALDAATNVRKNTKKGQRLDIKDYQNAVAKKDSKMTRPLQYTYETLHLVLGYDGNLNYKVVQAGLEQGKNIIAWASKHYKE
jgi:hypothetical protein